MASSPRTKLRIAASVLLAPGFFDALAGRFLWQPVSRKAAPCPVPEKRRWRDLAGALHIHTTYSDGAGDVPTVMEAASAAGVDWILLADHNTQQPRRDGWEARYDDKPLLLIGTEVTVRGGTFLLALDMPPDWEPTRDLPAQTVVDEIVGHGGMPLVSLPFDIKHPWRDWDVRGVAGLEVVNLSTIARRHINVPSLAWLLPLFRARGASAVLRALLTRPDQALAVWDRLTAGGHPSVGIGALDAHALMKIGKNKYPLPSYEDVFRVVTTHALVPETHENTRRAIYDALRAGRCFIAYEGLGDPKGFTFTARAGEHESVMGECISLRPGGVHLSARAGDGESDGRVVLRLLKGGRIVAAGIGSVAHTAEAPGVYRVEAFRFAGRVGSLLVGARPWIFSNPIYLR